MKKDDRRFESGGGRGERFESPMEPTNKEVDRCPPTKKTSVTVCERNLQPVFLKLKGLGSVHNAERNGSGAT